jgi:hypothetical protein
MMTTLSAIEKPGIDNGKTLRMGIRSTNCLQ